ncbi:MAG TPA: hypothetical protein VJA21_20785 [Verrucomicrobiae bacterium]
MSVLQFRVRFIVGVIVCVVLAFLVGRFTGFEVRWRGLSDGMTQAEVRRVLGAPTRTGSSGCIGAGNKPVERWEYRRHEAGRAVYHYVDFDFIGAGGTPVVFRTERYRGEWTWLSCMRWWARAKCR